MFKEIKLIGASLLIATVSATTSIAAGDPWVGEYNGNCPDAQCFVEITKKKGKNYNVVYTARDRMNYNKILCKAVIPMKRGRVQVTDTNHEDDGLTGGKYKSAERSYIIGGSGEFYFFIPEKCGKYEIDGNYGAFGDI